MNIEKVYKLTDMIISVTKELDEIAKNNYDLRGLCLKLAPLISVNDTYFLPLTESEEAKFFSDNQGKTDLIEAERFYEENRHGIDSAFDAMPEEVTGLIANTDIEIKKSFQRMNTIYNAIRKIKGEKKEKREKECAYMLLNSLYRDLSNFSEVFKEYLKDNDPQLTMLKPFFIDENKARTFLRSIKTNPDKTSVLGKYKQQNVIKPQKFSALLRTCKEMGWIGESPDTIRQRIKRTTY